MNNSYPNEADATSDDSNNRDEGASLIIYADQEGHIGFECEWGEGISSITSMGLIFYRLLEENLTDEILEFLKKQCVIQNRIEEYDTILQAVTQMKLLKKSSNVSDGDSIVISPSDAAKM